MLPAHPTEQLAYSQEEALIRFDRYSALTGETKTVAYAKMAAGVAPKPLKDGRASVWRLSEVRAYVARKIATLPRKA